MSATKDDLNRGENRKRRPLETGVGVKSAPKNRKGDVWVWLSAAGMSITLFMLLGLVALVLMNGLAALWPSRLVEMTLKDGSLVMGELKQEDDLEQRIQLKTGNRDLYGNDFRWVDLDQVTAKRYPDDAIVLERLEHGHFFGFLTAINLLGQDRVTAPDQLQSLFQEALVAMSAKREELEAWESEMASLNTRIESQRLALLDARGDDAKERRIRAQQEARKVQFESLRDRVADFRREVLSQTLTVRDAGGREKVLPVFAILRAYRPNEMNLVSRFGLYSKRMLELLTEPPREANTEGGLFPAIFGTAMMVILMSIFTMPLGVVAAVYLREYAKEGALVRLVRITVNNLAGVPSIVYGIFGLGFFVYGIGGTIDDLFFSNRLPTPTYGTGGLLWASLTMALLTLPVVIVATEEGLSAVPKGLRDGSLALGATKFQTLMRVVLPMASPGMLTGLILSIARAAGEVAPLMLVGVAKLAANLVVDDVYPYFHPERKFMHLGFHIYDVGFQSPNVEAAIPMVFVTTLLLLVMVLGLSSVAMVMRQRMRSKYTAGAF